MTSDIERLREWQRMAQEEIHVWMRRANDRDAEIERLRSELRRLTDIVERIAVEADGSTPDTSNARSLLGDLYPCGGQDDA